MPEAEKQYGLTLTGRSTLTVTGVTEVDSFNEEMVALSTQDGPLTVLGSGLKIGQLSLDNGKMWVQGKIDVLSYADRREMGALLRRILR